MGLFLPGDDRSGIWIDLELAEKLGINSAIIIGRILWWIEKHITENEKNYFKEGRWWMYESLPSLQKYSTLGRDSILRVIKQLREAEIVLSHQFERSQGHNYNFYAIDAPKLTAILAQGGLVAKPDQGG